MNKKKNNEASEMTSSLLSGEALSKSDQEADVEFIMEEMRKTEKKERLANITNLKAVISICIDNRIKKIKYGDVELEFKPDEIPFPGTPPREPSPDSPDEEGISKFNPDYLLENPPEML